MRSFWLKKCIMLNSVSESFYVYRKKCGIAILILLVMLLFVMLMSFKFGAVSLSLQDIFADNDSINHRILLELRLPRVITPMLVGAALAIAGVIMQGLFRNPMADPALIGMSSGASLFTFAFALLTNHLEIIPLWLNSLGITLSAFSGSLLVALLTYSLSIYRGNSNIGILLLAGIAINALCGAGIGLLTYFANDDVLRSITFWSMGSFANANYNAISFISLSLVICLFILRKTPVFLDSLLIGESYAKVLGFNLSLEKHKAILALALLVGVATAFVGPIGFVGLVVPHIMRFIVGNHSHRNLLVVSSLYGALLLTLADLVARTIARPADVPIGIITALIGAPYFMFLLLRKRAQIGG